MIELLERLLVGHVTKRRWAVGKSFSKDEISLKSEFSIKSSDSMLRELKLEGWTKFRLSVVLFLRSFINCSRMEETFHSRNIQSLDNPVYYGTYRFAVRR